MRGRGADGFCGLSDRRNLLLSGLHALDLIVLGCILLWIILALLYMGKRKKDKEKRREEKSKEKENKKKKEKEKKKKRKRKNKKIKKIYK